jgi:membrane-associated phospholipid phosphatase
LPAQQEQLRLPSKVRLQAVSAAVWMSVLIAALLAFLAAARLAGLRIEFEFLPTAQALGVLGVFALLAHRTLTLVPRVSLVAAFTFVLWGGGLAGGVLCMIGPMFNFPLIDPTLAAADRWIGVTSADAIRWIVAIPFAPKLLYSMYFPSVILLYLSAFTLACLGRAERLWELCSAYGFCLAVATICSVILPASGAFEYLHLEPLFGAQLPAGSGVYHLEVLHTLRRTTHLHINPLDLHGLVTFPSFHTGMALMTAAAWRDDRYLRWPMFVWNGLVIVSTVPVGGHYLIDLIAGAFTWFLIFRYGSRWAEAFIWLQSRIAGKLMTAPELEGAQAEIAG